MRRRCGLVPAGQSVVIDGQKTDGIDAILKDCRALGLHVGEALSKAHGKLACDQPGDRLGGLGGRADARLKAGFKPCRGCFLPMRRTGDRCCWRRPCLQNCRPRGRSGRGLGISVARGSGARRGKALDLVEADARRFGLARGVNITDPRAQFSLGGCNHFQAGKTQWDAVVMNPPFHAGRDAEPALGHGVYPRGASRVGRIGQLGWWRTGICLTRNCW